MKAFWLAAAVGVSLMASAGGASADPWKDESGHGRFGGGHWKHERHGEGWGERGPRGRGYYEERGGYRGSRFDGPRFRDYDHPRFRGYDRYGY